MQTHHGCVKGAGLEAFVNRNVNLVWAEQKLLCSDIQWQLWCAKMLEGVKSSNKVITFSAVKTAEHGHFL
jgi:hypothetical protein